MALTTLDSLLALGAYVNAGHIDFYDGKSHIRFGSVDVNGNVTYEANSAHLANALVLKEALDAIMSEGEKVYVSVRDPNSKLPVEPAAPA